MTLRILPFAELDIQKAAFFYESQRIGLGAYFRDCITDDVDSLISFAGIHEKQGGYFRCLSDRFPYPIFYDISENTIDVYAIMDCRQDPDAIDRRLLRRR